jgi:hypothetical protein
LAELSLIYEIFETRSTKRISASPFCFQFVFFNNHLCSFDGQPQVSSASVNLATETAIVWPVSEAKVVPNWQKELGEALAKHLTSCGFMSNLRGKPSHHHHCSGHHHYCCD